MTDPNLQDFYARIARVQAGHSRGMGFEAQGTLGRSAYARPRRRRLNVIKPLIVAGLCVIALKATIHYHIGDGVYRARVAIMATGDEVDRLGALAMAPDAVTLWVSGRLQAWMPR